MSYLLVTNGCSPGKFNSQIMEWNPGAMGDVNGIRLIEVPTVMYTNLAAIGIQPMNQTFFNSIGRTMPGLSLYGNLYIGGRDASFTLNAGTQLYWYLLYQISTGITAFTASQATIYSDVHLPTGWTPDDTTMRKAPFGCNYNPAWDGIPDFALLNWPMPCIKLSLAEDAALWHALPIGGNDGTSYNWQTISLAQWMPDNARVVFFSAEVRLRNGYTSGASAYVRSVGNQTTGLCVGSVFPTAQSSRISPMGGLRVASGLTMEYRCDVGAQLYITVLGYSMTEPS